MNIEDLIAHYGLFAVFVGAGLEGETVVLTGGVLAQRHLFPLGAAMLASTTGSFLVDQLWFFLGRHCRGYAWIQRLTQQLAFARAIAFFEKHPVIFILGFRFVYGMRTISPFAIGTTQLPARTFVLLNAIAAAIWGPLFTYLGYEFGKAIGALMPYVRNGALIAIAIAICIAVIAAVYVYLRRSSDSRR